MDSRSVGASDTLCNGYSPSDSGSDIGPSDVPLPPDISDGPQFQDLTNFIQTATFDAFIFDHNGETGSSRKEPSSPLHRPSSVDRNSMQPSNDVTPLDTRIRNGCNASAGVTCNANSMIENSHDCTDAKSGEANFGFSRGANDDFADFPPSLDDSADWAQFGSKFPPVLDDTGTDIQLSDNDDFGDFTGTVLGETNSTQDQVIMNPESTHTIQSVHSSFCDILSNILSRVDAALKTSFPIPCGHDVDAFLSEDYSFANDFPSGRSSHSSTAECLSRDFPRSNFRDVRAFWDTCVVRKMYIKSLPTEYHSAYPAFASRMGLLEPVRVNGSGSVVDKPVSQSHPTAVLVASIAPCPTEPAYLTPCASHLKKLMLGKFLLPSMVLEHMTLTSTLIPQDAKHKVQEGHNLKYSDLPKYALHFHPQGLLGSDLELDFLEQSQGPVVAASSRDRRISDLESELLATTTETLPAVPMLSSILLPKETAPRLSVSEKVANALKSLPKLSYMRSLHLTFPVKDNSE